MQVRQQVEARRIAMLDERRQMLVDHDDRLRVHGIPNHVGSRRFNARDMQSLLSWYKAAMASNTAEDCEVPVGPLPPPMSVRQGIEHIASRLPPSCSVDDAHVPWWVRMMCRNPEYWRNACTSIAFKLRCSSTICQANTSNEQVMLCEAS